MHLVHGRAAAIGAALALVAGAGCASDSNASDSNGDSAEAVAPSAGSDEADGLAPGGDEGADEPQGGRTRGPGSVSASVTGDVEGDFAGHATYTDASLEMNDFSMHLSDNQTFAISLTMRVEDNSPPPVGSYTIGRVAGPDEFYATYSAIGEGGMLDRTEYEPTGTGAGTLNITSSSDTEVTGKFEFSAEHEDRSITVTDCEFQAIQVRGGM